MGGYEGDVPLQHGGQLRETDTKLVARITDGADDGADDELQILDGTGLAGDDLPPVPLIHVNGVDVVQLLVAADGVHVGIESMAYGEAVPLEGQALPLRQGVDHLGLLADGGDVKGNGALIAVQIIVQTRGIRDEQGCGDPLEIQGVLELGLEVVFDVGNGTLGVVGIQDGLIALGDIAFIHGDSLLSGERKIDGDIIPYPHQNVKRSRKITVEGPRRRRPGPRRRR